MTIALPRRRFPRTFPAATTVVDGRLVAFRLSPDGRFSPAGSFSAEGRFVPDERIELNGFAEIPATGWGSDDSDA